MNPHDQLTRPPAHRVYERLGADDVWTLLRRHPEASLAWHLASSATAVDGIHRELTATAKSAVEKLSPVADGEYAGQSTYDGILRESGLRIDLLAARREAAFAQFAVSLTAYARCTGADRKATTGARPRQQLSPQPPPASPAGWDNVEPLIDTGLIAAGRSTSSARMGHMLSLTSAGHRALEVAHAARQHETAASYRGRTAAVASFPAPPAAAPACLPLSPRTR